MEPENSSSGRPDIIVTDVSEAVDIVKKNPKQYRVLSISTPGDSIFAGFSCPNHHLPFENAQEVLYLTFDDISEEMKPLLPDLKNVRMATEEDCRESLRFLHKGGKRLVHCRAGISRSTSMVLGYLLDVYPDYRSAIDHLLEIRPCAEPNTHVMRLMCRILGKSERYREIFDYIEYKRHGDLRKIYEERSRKNATD